jgi:hypothetical protein
VQQVPITSGGLIPTPILVNCCTQILIASDTFSFGHPKKLFLLTAFFAELQLSYSFYLLLGAAVANQILWLITNP